MVFYPKSPRNVPLPVAQAIAREVPPFVTLTGLFVNPAPEDVRAILDAVPLQLLQFHGDEAPAFCASFNYPWVKVARMRPGLDLVEYAARFYAAGAKGLVLDAHTEEYGGAGIKFDWSMIPANLPLPLILAGGLNPDNVAEAIVAVRPWAVDVSSGVENPDGPKGIKDHAKIAQFIAGANNESL